MATIIDKLLVQIGIDAKGLNKGMDATIKKLKDSWNREEVIKLLKLLKKDTINSIDLDINTDNLICDLEINKWIEKNL